MAGPIMETAAVTAAIREVADAEILPKFRALTDDEIIEKRPGDVVTVADRLAEQALTRIFRAVIDGAESGEAAGAALAALIPPMPFSRGFMFGTTGAE